MTPEQENELVAKWMGWEYFSPAKSGMTTGDPPHWRAPKEHFRLGSKVYRCPHYRTDPALLWELMERLAKRGWSCRRLTAWIAYYMVRATGGATEVHNTLAEAVFAAAVMQAGQEGE